jgi:hypothetical protein
MRHSCALPIGATFHAMEWILQVWDEIDDAAATIAQWWMAQWWMGPLSAFSSRRRFTPTDVP